MPRSATSKATYLDGVCNIARTILQRYCPARLPHAEIASREAPPWLHHKMHSNPQPTRMCRALCLLWSIHTNAARCNTQTTCQDTAILIQSLPPTVRSLPTSKHLEEPLSANLHAHSRKAQSWRRALPYSQTCARINAENWR